VNAREFTGGGGPINGVVMERFLHPGEVAESRAGGRPMLKLAQTDVLNVEALLPAKALIASR
jgi:hypothetical protein